MQTSPTKVWKQCTVFSIEHMCFSMYSVCWASDIRSCHWFFHALTSRYDFTLLSHAFLHQRCFKLGMAHSCFLKIGLSVMFVCVCVCVSAPKPIDNLWCDMIPKWLDKQVLQVLYGSNSKSLVSAALQLRHDIRNNLMRVR